METDWHCRTDSKVKEHSFVSGTKIYISKSVSIFFSKMTTGTQLLVFFPTLSWRGLLRFLMVTSVKFALHCSHTSLFWGTSHADLLRLHFLQLKKLYKLG